MEEIYEIGKYRITISTTSAGKSIKVSRHVGNVWGVLLIADINHVDKHGDIIFNSLIYNIIHQIVKDLFEGKSNEG
ncbi:MAG: hypothetical protein DRJ41_01900 [Thermoprotei archaeon]|nr:MAG: hypothetical protein DRJ41_01900 [Thermoprotei archaeon]